MVRAVGLNSPLLLGFDAIERALDKASKRAYDGYPPYNIERIGSSGNSPEILRITIAVAGFGQDQIEVTQEENQLFVRGRQQEDKTRESRHRRAAVSAQLPPRRRHRSAWRRTCQWTPVD